MKKILSILLAMTLIFSLAACTPKTDEPAKDGTDAPAGEAGEAKVLKIAGLDGGYGRDHWDELASKFEAAHEGVKVELTLEKNIAEILRPQIQAEDYPDIIYLSVGSAGNLTDTLVKEKAVMDISDLLEMDVPGEEAKVKDKIIDGFADTLITNPYGDGKTYLAPLFYGPTGLFYNADLFGEGKYALPETWDEMNALGETAKADDMALLTYPITGYFDTAFFGLLHETAGPEGFEKAMNYEVDTWKGAEVKDAFEIIGNVAPFVHKDTVSNANPEGFVKNQQLILDNKALFIPNGAWLPGEMAEAPRADGFEWGFMALPKTEDSGDRYAYTFFEQMFIPEGAKEAELAKEFMAYMYSDEAAKIVYEKSGAVQPIEGAVDFMDDEDPNKAIYTVYDDGTKPAMGGFASAPAVEGVDLQSGQGILFGTINSIVTGDKTVDQWHNEVVEAVEKIKKAVDEEN